MRKHWKLMCGLSGLVVAFSIGAYPVGLFVQPNGGIVENIAENNNTH